MESRLSWVFLGPYVPGSKTARWSFYRIGRGVIAAFVFIVPPRCGFCKPFGKDFIEFKVSLGCFPWRAKILSKRVARNYARYKANKRLTMTFLLRICL